MSTCVFLGPSAPLDAARAALDATYLPPARRGDLRAATETHAASRLILIDGYFEQVPSVWHKEILWALDQGIDVWGAASMGALRAAELASFGMRGHGRIFEAYRTGRFAPFDDPFEDDDEVAVVHGPEEMPHVATEAMVDVRATLADACDAQVISPAVRDQIAVAAKSVFYKERTWQAVLAAAPSEIDTDALAAWLPHGSRSQKRDDALGVLDLIARGVQPADPPPFHFERTLIWEIAEHARADYPRD